MSEVQLNEQLSDVIEALAEAGARCGGKLTYDEVGEKLEESKASNDQKQQDMIIISQSKLY